MEFPDLGKHCSETFCRQMDFLPVKCDACQKVFCKDHFTYNQHHCPSAYKKDVQVPVCPLCSAPVPIKRGDVPDAAVSLHIDNECKSDPAVKKRKIYTNRCNKKGCKVKELIKVTCDSCALNFCLTHRHPQDHECAGPARSAATSRAGLAAMQRLQASQSAPRSGGSAGSSGSVNRWSRNAAHPSHSELQGSLTEDQALARAIQASLSESKPMTQEEMDQEIAQALAASDESHQASTTRTQRSANNCAMA